MRFAFVSSFIFFSGGSLLVAFFSLHLIDLHDASMIVALPVYFLSLGNRLVPRIVSGGHLRIISWTRFDITPCFREAE